MSELEGPDVSRLQMIRMLLRAVVGPLEQQKTATGTVIDWALGRWSLSCYVGTWAFSARLTENRVVVSRGG